MTRITRRAALALAACHPRAWRRRRPGGRRAQVRIVVPGRGRRHHRHHGAPARAAPAGALGHARGGGEPRRRRRHHRHAGGGARARPTARTLLSGNIGPQAIAYSLFRNLPYRAEQTRARSPARSAGRTCWWCNPSRAGAAPWRNSRPMLRAQPGRSSATPRPGVGQSPHLAGVWCCQLTGRGGDPRALPRRRPGADRAASPATSQFMIDNLTGVHRADPRRRACARSRSPAPSATRSCPTCRRCARPCPNWPPTT